MSNISSRKQPKRKLVTPKATPSKEERKRNLLLFPVLPLFFCLIWLWGTFYYGDVLRIAREQSFWVSDTAQMKFVLDQSYGMLWYAGRLALQLFRYPMLGSLLLAFLLTLSSWLLGYNMRLSSRLRWIQYLPALIYIGCLSYEGIDLFFEVETGRIMGVPLLATFILSIWAIIIRSFSRKDMPALCSRPKDETSLQNYIQLAVCVVGLCGSVLFTQWKRPYVPVISRMMLGQINQDWNAVQQTARNNAELSHRIIAAYYAMALVQTDQIGERVYDIRLDYDSIYIHGWNREDNSGANLYIPEGSYYAGLVETGYHYAFENLVMNGPSIRTLELLTKCALMRNEWILAEKYLRILRQVPFTADFCDKYGSMVRNPKQINADPEMANIRQLQPIHDSFENVYQKPTFMGYNLSLREGRSMNAIKNSIAVCLYTKLMPNFVAHLEPLAGSTPPENFADGILLASNKFPELQKMFSNLDFRATRLEGFLQEVQPYLKDRQKYANELFPRYKGYYPYYYFFGNLKATKRNEAQKQTSNSGVN